MRTAFIEELLIQAAANPEVFLVVGDLGFSVVERFAEKFPDRFLNVGVAEQNMTGVAAGLASEGYHPFTYSIANFPTLRCFEQIRNDIAYHNLPVTIVAVGGGMAYGNLGYSHHAVQDLGLMRSLPNMTVLAPADPGETKECVQWLARHPTPSYLRLGKAGERRLHAVRGIDKGPLMIRDGTSSCAIISTGGILDLAIEAADMWQRLHFKNVAIFSCPLLQPLDAATLEPLKRFKALIVLEEHGPIGGLASILFEQLAGTVEIHPLNIRHNVCNLVGSQQYLRQQFGLSAEAICQRLE
jgi:transketolase